MLFSWLDSVCSTLFSPGYYTFHDYFPRFSVSIHDDFHDVLLIHDDSHANTRRVPRSPRVFPCFEVCIQQLLVYSSTCQSILQDFVLSPTPRLNQSSEASPFANTEPLVTVSSRSSLHDCTCFAQLLIAIYPKRTFAQH